jgi:hypothetical protein
MKDWKKKASEEAWGWEAKYAECFQLNVGRIFFSHEALLHFF